MSTNYYVNEPHEGLHIGKHSGGVEFCFASHPALGLTSVAAWREHLSQPGRTIVSEYGMEEGAEDFFADATRRPADDLRDGVKFPIHSQNLGHPMPSGFYRDMDARGVLFCAAEFC